MPSDVALCNLALAHLGDEASVSSIDPPEGSAQADHCRTFYPMARDSLLELHTWGFATRRTALSLITQNDSGPWAYTYGIPNLMINPLRVMDPNAVDDYSSGVALPGVVPSVSDGGQGIYTPVPFVIELGDDGNNVLLTNLQDALLVHTITVTDTTKFSPLFNMTLSYLLASFLAGPVLKGETGRAVADSMLKKAMGFLPKATESDANSRRVQVRQSVPWVVGR